jgi:hypothetical protein
MGSTREAMIGKQIDYVFLGELYQWSYQILETLPLSSRKKKAANVTWLVPGHM